MGIKVANNAFATLASSITNSATSITLTTGQGARFPSLGAGDYFYATLVDTSNNLEIVKCTARSTDVLTVVRAQESTTARAYSAGDRIEIRLTAATFTDATQALPTQTGNAGKYLKTDGTNASWESISSVTPTSVSDQANSSTGYFDLPAGTTAQRPGSPGSGMVRFNTTLGYPEWYDPAAAAWKGFYVSANYTAEYLVVAGGGGGGGATRGGGGGAGGYRSSVVGESSGGGASAETVQTFIAGNTYAITVGAGGASGFYDAGNGAAGGANGSNSVLDAVVSTGGGGGGASDSNGTDRSPKSGGSGGGGWYQHGAGGSGTVGQGYAGGNSGTASPYGGGGGGAGGAGGNFNSGSGGFGGVGVSSSINGTATFRAGGGSSSDYVTNSGFSGGNGGGGVGRNAVGTTVGTAPSNGTANTGGGGGASGNGGSGVVIIRYLGTQRGTGGTVTSAGGYTIHTFTSSGTYVA